MSASSDSAQVLALNSSQGTRGKDGPVGATKHPAELAASKVRGRVYRSNQEKATELLREVVKTADTLRLRASEVITDCNYLKQKATEALTRIEVLDRIEATDVWLPQTVRELKRIQEEVAAFVGCTPELLRSDTRKLPIVRVRSVGVYLCRRYTQASSSEIGRVFNKDHSTVLHAVKRIEEQMQDGDTEIIEMVLALEHRLGFRSG